MRGAGLRIAAAFTLDLLIGDPPRSPHPVRAFGALIDMLEQRFNDRTSASRLRGGAVAVGLAAGAYGVSWALLAGARRVDPWFASVLEVGLGASTLASNDLLREGRSVLEALEADDLPRARANVARIVGRDTLTLTADEIARAAIETLAESAADGIIAPLFWLAVGGVPAALAFKMISTMDSMIGHRDERYAFFGAVAARLDDAANFVPARLTAGLIALLCATPLRVIGTVVRDAGKHESPNAGWPEAAMAAALDVRLGGTNWYAGYGIVGARFHESGRSPDEEDVQGAIALVQRVALAAAVCAIVARS